MQFKIEYIDGNTQEFEGGIRDPRRLYQVPDTDIPRRRLRMV